MIRKDEKITKSKFSLHIHFKYALMYIQQKFPLNNELLANARWIDVSKRIESKWESVEYFLERYSNLLIDIPHDALFDEFSDYQTLTANIFINSELLLVCIYVFASFFQNPYQYIHTQIYFSIAFRNYLFVSIF
jgi:hypothetical protein